MQVQVQAQLAHLGRGKGVGGQQRMRGVGGFDVFEHHRRLAHSALGRDQVGHLAQRRRAEVGFAYPGQFFFEGHAFFEQGQLDLVVVVAGRETAELEHGSPL
ncbi:hypothetical protein D3C78_1426910 [compost metagenome]